MGILLEMAAVVIFRFKKLVQAIFLYIGIIVEIWWRRSVELPIFSILFWGSLYSGSVAREFC